jgi:thiol-disulfide isomerase/thioredoxin
MQRKDAAMSLAVANSNLVFPRRTLLRGLVYVPLAALLVACGARSQSSEPLPSTSLDTFPTGLGRGFPSGTLVGADNSVTGVNAGDIAPNFRLQLNDDQGLYLSDLANRPILINFWATWCGPCRLEMPEIVRHSAANQDLLVIAINVQEELAPVEAFASDFDMTMPVVLDTDGEVRDLYQVRGMPTSIFIDREGKVSTYWEGVLSPSKLEECLTLIL